MFKNILIPCDLRFVPKLALSAAASLAHGGAKLTLLYVTDPSRDFPEAASAEIDDDTYQRYEAHINKKIDNIVAVLAEYEATATTWIVQRKRVHAAINDVAKALRADAILMGTHGRRGLSRLLRGSVTERVSREADVPVIVVRESSKSPFLPLFQERRGHV